MCKSSSSPRGENDGAPVLRSVVQYALSLATDLPTVHFVVFEGKAMKQYSWSIRLRRPSEPKPGAWE